MNHIYLTVNATVKLINRRIPDLTLDPVSRRGVKSTPTETDTGPAAEAEAATDGPGSDAFGLDEFMKSTAPGKELPAARKPRSSKLKLKKRQPAEAPEPTRKTKAPKASNSRSLETLAGLLHTEHSKLPQGYLDDFQRFCDCMRDEKVAVDAIIASGDLAVDHWWTGSGGSGLKGCCGLHDTGMSEGGEDLRLMPPFDIKLVEEVFAPWMLKFWNRADLTAYEYAINYMFSREDKRFVKDSGQEPWRGKDFDQINLSYKSLKATLDDGDGKEKNAGGANKLREDTVEHLLSQGERQWTSTQDVHPNQVAKAKAITDFSETMAVLTGITLMARSNSSGGIREADILPHLTDGSLTINVRVWARKGSKRRAQSKAECRSTPMRVPPGKPLRGGGEHPRNRYIALMRKLKALYAHGGGLPLFEPKSSASKMTALIKRVLGGKKKCVEWMFETGTLPSSHTLRKTAASMADSAGAPRQGRFLRWGGWDDPRAISSYCKGSWSGSGFSHLYFDWLVDYSI